MIRLLKNFLTLLPWLLLLVILFWITVEQRFFHREPATQETYQSAILVKLEQMGKLELVKYNFQEVTEVKKVAEYIDLRLFKYKPTPDSKAVLISSGMAVGCVDLTKLTKKDILEDKDTVHVHLPGPELCFFKIDLEKSRIYDLQIDYMNGADKAEFMEKLYAQAEINIKKSALEMGILEQTKENAAIILVPLFESLTGKKVQVTFDMTADLFWNK